MSTKFSKQYDLKKKSEISDRWGGNEELTRSWTPISRYFLANYHRLSPHQGADGLNSTEAMLLVHLLDFKWDENDPHPSVNTLATRLGLSRRRTRKVIQNLEDLGFLTRKPRVEGSTNAYDLQGLFDELMELYEADKEEGV